MSKDTCCIPTGNLRLLTMRVAMQGPPSKLQAEFKDYDGMNLIWKDVPIVYVDPEEFHKTMHPNQIERNRYETRHAKTKRNIRRNH